jgi:oligoribonuclease (3'-5' exoribonuclease)
VHPLALAFTDTETTGLDPVRHALWEIAIIRREPDGTETEHLWQIRPTRAELAVADLEALCINRYHDRAAVPGAAVAADMLADAAPLGYLDVARRVFAALDGAVLVGSNPHFDASFLHRFLQTGRVPWHYRPVDVATLAAGYVHGASDATQYPGADAASALPFSSRDLSRAVGVEPPGPDAAHTALGDARWARDVFDAVTGGGA